VIFSLERTLMLLRAGLNWRDEQITPPPKLELQWHRWLDCPCQVVRPPLVHLAQGGGYVTTRVFGEENLTPCTFVGVPGSAVITYKTHYRIISFPHNEIRAEIKILTSETIRYTNLVQAPWAKRQIEILRSGS
jgi:hypothetical protein